MNNFTIIQKSNDTWLLNEIDRNPELKPFIK